MPPAIPTAVNDEGLATDDIYSATAKNFNIAKGDYGRKQWTKALTKKTSTERLEHLNKIVVEECDKRRRLAKKEGVPLHVDYQKVYDWGLITKDKDGNEVSHMYHAMNPIAAVLGIGIWSWYLYRAIEAESSWQAWAFTIVVCFFTEDVIGSVVHINLDEVKNLVLPKEIGKLVLEFRWHHIIPRDIALEPLDAVIMDMFGPATVLLLIFLAAPCLYFEIEGAWVWMVVKSTYALQGQVAHRSAHMYEHETNSLTKMCQKLGLFVSRATHQAHHKGDHNTNFPITNGSVNWIFDSVYKHINNGPVGIWFWRLMFFVSLYDIAFFGVYINHQMTSFDDILSI